MLHLGQFDETPIPVPPDSGIGDGIKLVFDKQSRMRCTVRRWHRTDAHGHQRPTLIIDGAVRTPEDWFGIEIALPDGCDGVSITCRNYPVHRLFPRLHFDMSGRIEHLDLAHVAAHDAFATRFFDAAEWRAAPIFRERAPSGVRLTVLVPSTPWFAMEIAQIRIHEATDA